MLSDQPLNTVFSFIQLSFIYHLLDQLLALFNKSANTVPSLAADVILFTSFTDVNSMSFGSTLAQAFSEG